MSTSRLHVLGAHVTWKSTFNQYCKVATLRHSQESDEEKRLQIIQSETKERKLKSWDQYWKS